MSRTQKRRAINVRDSVYQRIRAAAGRTATSGSSIVEKTINVSLDAIEASQREAHGVAATSVGGSL